jgi:hypothetical protein
MPCGLIINRRFRETCLLHLQSRRWYLPLKCRFITNPHDATSQKTVFFIVTAVTNENLFARIVLGRRVQAITKCLVRSEAQNPVTHQLIERTLCTTADTTAPTQAWCLHLIQTYSPYHSLERAKPMEVALKGWAVRVMVKQLWVYRAQHIMFSVCDVQCKETPCEHARVLCSAGTKLVLMTVLGLW